MNPLPLHQARFWPRFWGVLDQYEGQPALLSEVFDIQGDNIVPCARVEIFLVASEYAVGWGVGMTHYHCMDVCFKKYLFRGA